MDNFQNWPLRYNDLLLLENFNSNIGVVCHWTLKSIIADGLKNKNYAVLGQLYSRDVGISSIIRNVMAHPYLDTLILCGNEGAIEETKSSKAFLNLIAGGVDQDHYIINSQNARIEKEIPADKIDLFRQRIKIINLIGYNDAEKIQKAIDENFKNNPNKYETFIFPEPEKTENLELPSESAVFVARRQKVAECWIDILREIMLFGKIKGSQYGERQKEIIDMIAVVEDEDLDNPYLPDYFLLNEKQIKEYIPTLTTAKTMTGAKYTYGQRLRDHEGIDQIQNIINVLSKAPHSRRAVTSTWNVKSDSESENPPCIDLVQALVSQNKLSLTVYIRSNDMFLGWPENAFGILALQKLIIEETNKKNPSIKLEKGPIITISASAHIYERNWEEAKKLLKDNIELKCAWDPRGYFIIAVADEKIKVYNSNDPTNLKWEGKTAREIMDQIIFYISIMPHAADLGMELMKAELALKYGGTYIQDQPLKLK